MKTSISINPVKLTWPLILTSLTWLSSLAVGQGQSIIPIPSFGANPAMATSLNDHGQVVGYAFLSDQSVQHAFLASSAGIQDLGTLGGLHSVAFGINGAGHVIGQASTANNETHAFLFRDGHLVDLGALGGVFSTATALNESSQVVGYATLPGYSANHAFLFDQDTMMDLGTLGGTSSSAVDINNHGQIAGTASTASGDNHVFLYSDGSMQDLGSLGGLRLSVYDLNDNGLIVGQAMTPSRDTHAFMALGNAIADLDTLGGTFSSAQAVNESDQIIGYATVEGNVDMHAFLFSGGHILDLGTLGGPFSYAYDINNHGQIVGDTDDADGRTVACLWQQGLLIDLNSLLPPGSGWELTSAVAINEAHQVLGMGVYQDALTYFLLTLPSQNRPPIAEAGADQALECPGAITLDGSQSSDPDNESLTYAWRHEDTLLGQSARLTVNVPTGTHTFTLTVTDAAGAQDTDSVLVQVEDQTPPQISCPVSRLIQAGPDLTAPVPDLTGSVVATDNCADPDSLARTQSPPPGSQVGLGDHLITVTVSDPSGNQASCQTRLVVEKPCQLLFHSLTASPDLIRPPNRQMIPVTLAVQAESSCADEILSRIVSVTHNDTGSDKDKDSGPDWEITGALSLNLCAAVSPGASQRIYTITVQCADSTGNTETRQVTVTIEKGRSTTNPGPILTKSQKSQTR